MKKAQKRNTLSFQLEPQTITNQFKTTEEAEAAYQKAMNPNNNIGMLLKSSLVPKRFKGKSIKDIQLRNPETVDAVKTINSYLKTFPERLSIGSSGFICGNFGTGKTSLACIIVEAICRQGYAANYTTAWKMIQQIRQGYNHGDSVDRYIKNYINVPFLAIDEIGVQNGTRDERVLLYQVLDGRYSEIKPTLVISNLRDPVAEGYLDMRTIDRLKEGGGFSIEFNGISFRK